MVDQPARDGADFFAGGSAHVALYDTLYGRPAEAFGDLDFYAGLAEGRSRILDAACGTGRIAWALAAPERNVTGFDASPELLAVAQARPAQPGMVGTVDFVRARLESFAFDARFDLIILGYYGLSYVLEEAGRRACLERVRRHLSVDGLAVVHLPAPALLSRTVPPEELAGMRMRTMLPDREDRVGYALSFSVTSMAYEPERRQRHVASSIVVTDGDGRVRFEEEAVMTYAHIDREDLTGLAAEAGLAVRELSSGFRPGASEELVAVLAPL